jgi:hypothetical protein
MIAWGWAHQLIMDKWDLTGNCQEIRLAEEYLALLHELEEGTLPSIVSVMFKLVEGGQMQAESIGPDMVLCQALFSVCCRYS